MGDPRRLAALARAGEDVTREVERQQGRRGEGVVGVPCHEGAWNRHIHYKATRCDHNLTWGDGFVPDYDHDGDGSGVVPPPYTITGDGRGCGDGDGDGPGLPWGDGRSRLEQGRLS